MSPNLKVNKLLVTTPIANVLFDSNSQEFCDELNDTDSQRGKQQ